MAPVMPTCKIKESRSKSDSTHARLFPLVIFDISKFSLGYELLRHLFGLRLNPTRAKLNSHDSNLIPRVSHLAAMLGMREPGNETSKFSTKAVTFS